MITVSTHGAERNELDVVLLLAWTLKFHDCDPNAVRRTARELSRKAPYENRPSLKRLAVCEADGKVLDVAWNIFDQVAGPVEAPRCHMKPMILRGRAFYCQHCTHIKKRSF